MFDNDINDIDKFELTMPDEAIESEIYKQMDRNRSVYVNSKNFLSIFYTKHMIDRDNRETDDDDNDPEAIENQNYTIDEFYGNVINKLKEICGIYIDTKMEFDPIIVNLIFSFLVIRLHDNIVKYIKYVLLSEKQTFVNTFKDKIRNLSFKQARKYFKDKADAFIYTNYSFLIDNILESEDFMNPEQILKILFKLDPNDYECLTTNNMYSVCRLSFDISFFTKYIQDIYRNELNKMQLKSDVMTEITYALVPIRDEEIQQEEDKGELNTNE